MQAIPSSPPPGSSTPRRWWPPGGLWWAAGRGARPLPRPHHGQPAVGTIDPPAAHNCLTSGISWPDLPTNPSSLSHAELSHNLEKLMDSPNDQPTLSLLLIFQGFMMSDQIVFCLIFSPFLLSRNHNLFYRFNWKGPPIFSKFE